MYPQGAIRHTVARLQVAGAVALLLILQLSGCRPRPSEAAAPAGMIRINALAAIGPLQRTPVLFPHDLHATSLDRTGTGCRTCHPVDAGGVFSQSFFRWEDTDKRSLMNLYHEACVGCHRQASGSGRPPPPTTCGQCHDKRPRQIAPRSPSGLDPSLHARHIDALVGDCSECHHQYDPDTRAVHYVEGQEASCRDCHRARAEEAGRPFRRAAHQACIGCHLRMEVGPRHCGECHDADQQQAVERLEEIPRLERGQPDTILLRASSQVRAGRMNAVAFDHRAHEAAAPTCRHCHHETLSACTGCHAAESRDKGGGIDIHWALHATTSERSCVGCHETRKTDPDCAGCHGPLGRTSANTMACKGCHAGPQPRTAVRGAPLASPARVEIGSLSETFEPVLFEHGKHAERLGEIFASSRLADRFHDRPGLLCQGCHHHAPMGEQGPPRCVTCHGAPAAGSGLLMPRLVAAYHRQCMGCHRRMEIPGASSCAGCHAEKIGSETAP